MDNKKAVLTIKKTHSESFPNSYSLYADGVIISQSCSPAWLVANALQMYYCDPQIYVLDRELCSIFKILNASFDEKDKN